MGYHHCPSQYRTLQARPCRCPILSCQGRRTSLHRQYLLHLWPARYRRPSKLRSRQSWCDRFDEDYCKGVGSRFRRASEHRCFRAHYDEVDGGEGGGCIRDDPGRREGGIGNPTSAEGRERRRCCRIQGYSAWTTGYGDGGGQCGIGSGQPTLQLCQWADFECDWRQVSLLSGRYTDCGEC